MTIPFLRWRIEIYEIIRFCSLKTFTRGFRNCWLRKWGRKIDIFIYKMASRFKMANWNLRGKQYWSLKFCTWEFFESLSTNVIKNRSWLFNSLFCRERVVLNDDIWEKNKKKISCALYITSKVAKIPFFEHITSNISKSWRDRLIRILRRKLPRKWSSVFQQQIQTHYLQTCVIGGNIRMK